METARPSDSSFESETSITTPYSIFTKRSTFAPVLLCHVEEIVSFHPCPSLPSPPSSSPARARSC